MVSQTKTTAASNDKAAGAPQPINKAKPTGKIAETVRGHLGNQLQEHFEEFLKQAWFEEKHFLNEVLENWSANAGGGYPKERGAREVPLFSAIEIELSGNNCVPCPDYLTGKVEEFTAARPPCAHKIAIRTIIARPLYSPVGLLPRWRRNANGWNWAIDCYRAIGPSLAWTMSRWPLSR